MITRDATPAQVYLQYQLRYICANSLLSASLIALCAASKTPLVQVMTTLCSHTVGASEYCAMVNGRNTPLVHASYRGSETSMGVSRSGMLHPNVSSGWVQDQEIKGCAIAQDAFHCRVSQ